MTYDPMWQYEDVIGEEGLIFNDDPMDRPGKKPI